MRFPVGATNPSHEKCFAQRFKHRSTVYYIIIAKCVYTYLHPPTHIRTHIFHRIKCSSRLHTDAHTLFRCSCLRMVKFFSHWEFWWELKKTHRATIHFPLLIVGNVNTGLTQFSDFIFQTLDALLCLCACCTPNLSSFFLLYSFFVSSFSIWLPICFVKSRCIM